MFTNFDQAVSRVKNAENELQNELKKERNYLCKLFIENVSELSKALKVIDEDTIATYILDMRELNKAKDIGNPHHIPNEIVNMGWRNMQAVSEVLGQVYEILFQEEQAK